MCLFQSVVLGFVQQTEAFYLAAFVVHLSVFDYRIYSFKHRPRLSAAYESKNIKERRISAALIHNNAALNRSTAKAELFEKPN